MSAESILIEVRQRSGQVIPPTYYLSDLQPGEVDKTEQTNFYAHRWIIEGQEGYIVARMNSVALHRTYMAPFLSAVRVRRALHWLEADIFTLDVSNLPELPNGVGWLPVVLR